jgi:hypothetical protein
MRHGCQIEIVYDSSMVEFKIESDLPQLEEILSRVEPKELPFITSRALNKTAERALGVVQRRIVQDIDRPTPFAIKSIFVRAARKNRLEATIEWRQYSGRTFGAGRALFPQAFGGDRKQKGFEKALQASRLIPPGAYAVPSGEVPKDSFGNVPASFYVRILSFLRADRSGTQNAPVGRVSEKAKGNRAAAARYRQKKRDRLSKFFVVSGGVILGSESKTTGGRTRLPDGIYERIPSAFGAATRALFFYERSVKYRVIFPFEETVSRYVSTIIQSEFETAIDVAAKTRASFIGPKSEI